VSLIQSDSFASTLVSL